MLETVLINLKVADIFNKIKIWNILQEMKFLNIK